MVKELASLTTVIWDLEVFTVVPGGIFNAYCWTHSTFSLPRTDSQIHPGLGEDTAAQVIQGSHSRLCREIGSNLAELFLLTLESI